MAEDGYYEFTGLSYGTYTLNATAQAASRTLDFYYPHCVMTLNVTLPLSARFKPNTALIVVDDDASYYAGEGGAWPDEIASAAQVLGFNVFVWNESLYGRPTLDVLLNENVSVVVWHAGTFWHYAVDDVDADTLMEFVERGGRLLLEGEDIAYDHVNDTFMQLVAHAAFMTDSVIASSVTPTTPHPVVYLLQDLPFAAQPPAPDGVAPLEGGVEVARYAGTNYTAIVAYDGLPAGSGARVVYVAFPLHYLNETVRSQLINNTLRWLSSSYYAIVSTDRPAYPLNATAIIAATVYNGTEPMAGLSVTALIYYPDGSVDSITLSDMGNGTYSSTYRIPGSAPQGEYRLIVLASVPGELPAYAETTFTVFTGLSFSFKVEDVNVESGVVKMLITVSNNASSVITSVEYRLNWSGKRYVAEPVDGAYDEVNETVAVVINASSLPAGEYAICVRALTELGASSEWVTYGLVVRDLAKRYNLVALTVKPFKPMNASDLARAVGPALQAVWMWDVEAQEFKGYVPGVSGPEDDFPIEMGYGYFVYLSEPAKLVEVRA
ncbi:MAG: hypothetical protein DRJ57_05400 [Thermoprotei archaeon]|nr:MAG: hypothetical protein DRJ57_05400 [Thermoprotei archaeon]